MKILHTSDWHLGASVGQEKRYDEFEKILSALTGIVKSEKVEAIIVAGDVFDSGLPSNRAMEMYYCFLAELSKNSDVKSIIITAGNHDSASFLEAPKALLKAFKIHIVGKVDPENPDDLIIPLKDDNGNIAAVVCALPHLRDRDIRKAVSGQDVATQISSRQEAFIKIYQQTAARAAELYPSHPLIATGHFYLAGSVFSDSNQIVGTLNDINPASLPENIQYYALGHLHKPQNVGKSHRFRYSGSLLQMSFVDSNTAKSVTIIDSSALDAEPKIIELPCFIPMLKISGTADELKQQLDELKTKNAPCRIHAENTGDFEHELLQKLNKHCENSPLTILSCSNLKPNPALVKIRPKAQDLSKLTPADVFATLIEDFDTERKTELTAAFNEAVTALDEEDKNEE